MLAYVELIQRKEKEIGCDVLTHQKWYELPLFLLHISQVFEDIAGAAPNILTAFYRAYRPVLLALQLLERTLLSTLSKVLKIGLVCYMFIASGREM